jgi:hypothetical protein
MLIAAIRSGDALAGKAVSYSEDDGRFWLTGVGEIEPAKLLEYDAQGQVDWADDASRSWVMTMVGDAAVSPGAPEAAAPPAQSAATTGEVAAPAGPAPPAGSELDPDDAPSVAPVSSTPAIAPTAAMAKATPDAPVAVTAAQNLRRARQSRPEVVEGKKGLLNLSETQKRTIAFGAIGLVMVAAIVVLGVWGRGGGPATVVEDDIEYTEVFATTADDPLRTIDFEITTDRQRVEYTFALSDADNAGSYSVALVPATSPTQSDPSYVVARGEVEAGSDGATSSVDVALAPGSYGLRVIESNCDWSVKVSQAGE